MAEKTTVLLSDVTIKGNIIEKENLMTDSKIEGDITADRVQTYESSKITGNIIKNKRKYKRNTYIYTYKIRK